ncbi:anti-sigma factor family protein [Streptosporangium canum]|uniref:anti-sigma factor family protein n=1 Tax=Streptosporangium canum TaxID=324952 RepID=UPI0036911541
MSSAARSVIVPPSPGAYGSIDPRGAQALQRGRRVTDRSASGTTSHEAQVGMMRAGSRSGRAAGCREITELVTDYLEGALSAERRRRFEAHLAGCAECSVHLEQMRATIRALGCLGADGIPDRVLRRLCGAFLGSGAPPVAEGGQ